MCFKGEGAISTLSDKSLKLIDKFTYPSSNISSTVSDINIHLAAWAAFDRLSIIWKFGQSEDVAVYGYSTWTLTKLMEKKLDENKTKDATCCFKQILEATPQKTAVVQPISSHHTNYLRGVFNNFQTFFVQAFKIVVDSWKFTMLLIYILWDDWLLFMISGSNEQLQQQLEYTLLKTDCHSWGISKMQWGYLEGRYAIKFFFKVGKNATEMYRRLQTAFRPSCMNRASVFEWHKRFKEARESVRDDERCGRSKEVNTPQLIGQRVRVTMLGF